MDPLAALILAQQWADAHWWLAFWLAFWALAFSFFSIWGALQLVEGALKIVSRALRTIKVLVRGWPPAHLDADGDWKPAPPPQKETS